MNQAQAALPSLVRQRHTGEHTPLPAVELTDLSRAHKLILADARQQHGPDKPVDTASGKNADADDTVQIVGKVVVDAAALLWRHERRGDEVDVAEEEQARGGDGGAERRVPLVACRVPVDPQEAAGDKDVDHGERVRDDVEDEVVGVAWWRGQHDDHGHEPVLKEAG